MELLILFTILCIAAWLFAGYRRGWFRHLSIGSPPLLALSVILVGSCLGYDFYHRSFGPIPVTVDRILWGLLICQFVWTYFLRQADPKPIDRFDIIVLGLAILLTVSTLTHDWRYRDNMPMSRLLFFNLMPIGLFFAVRHSRLRLADIRMVFVALAGFGFYLAFVTIAEWREWYGLVFPRYIVTTDQVEFLGRGRGPFLNPVATGFYLIVCMAAAILCWPRAHRIQRVIIGGVTILCLAGVYATLTRSVWLSAFVALAIVVWIPAPNRWKGALLGSGTIAIALAVGLFANSFNSFKRDKYVSAAEMSQSVALRPMLAHVAIEMVKDRPMLGHGFGQYTKAKRLYHQDPKTNLPLKQVIPYMQHNVFLSYATELGLVGMTLLIGLLFGAVHSAWQLYRSSEEREFRGVALLVFTAVLTFVINGSFHDLTIIPMIGSLFFFVLALQSNAMSQVNREAATAPFDCREPLPMPDTKTESETAKRGPFAFGSDL